MTLLSGTPNPEYKMVSIISAGNAIRTNIGGGGTGLGGASRAFPDASAPAAFQSPQDEFVSSLLSKDGAGASLETPRMPSVAEEYTPEEQRAIAELRSRDREVRAHEQAHISVGGRYILGGAQFEYESGPDDRRYAVGGEVSIDTSAVPDDPEATIDKMQVVRAAALAPADPSAQDRAVAAAASREESRAAAELNELRAAEAAAAYEKNDAPAAQIIDLVG